MSLDPVDRLLAVADCTALMHEYGYRFDHGNGVGVADLFVDDGEWISPAVSCRGRDELIAFFTLRDQMTERLTRHVVTNITVTVHSADEATARSIAIEYRGNRGPDGMTTDTVPALVGDYEDEFVRVDGVWKFRRRLVILDFKRAGEVFLRAT
jgi:SnoaL-like domain